MVISRTDLLDTHRWKTIESASRYAQTVVHEAARAADLLPAPPKLPRCQKAEKLQKRLSWFQAIDFADISTSFTRERSFDGLSATQPTSPKTTPPR